MHINNMVRQAPIHSLIRLVADNEEQIESTHDRSAEIEVCAECGFGVVSSSNRVSCCENTRARVEGCVDAGLCDGDGLLFHGFVDGDLVADVHLVEFVDGADSSAVLMCPVSLSANFNSRGGLEGT